MRSARRHSASRTQSILARLKKATRHAGIELLENRRLLSAVVVNTAVDQTDAPGSPTISLRDALNLANNSITSTDITFDPTVFATPKTITLLNNAYLSLTSGQDVTITGPAAALTIDAGNNSGVLVDQASAGNVNISNMTLTNGYGYYGGGIDHPGADTLTITNVSITNCTAAYDGGGISNLGIMVITDCTITGNGNANITGTEGAGGGIDNNGGTLTVVDSTISGNSNGIAGSIGGGGISNRNGGTATLIGCTISGNTNYSSASGTPVNAPGGGVFSTGTLTVTNSTISGNTGSLGGGLCITGTTTLSDSTISGNAGTTGGGLYCTAADTIQNTVVSGNTYSVAGLGPDVASAGGTSVISNGFNFIGASDGSNGWTGTDVLGSVAVPLNPQLGVLANNGGPTQTMLPLGGSPLIDAGSNALIPSGITTDQRGFARINNTTVDVGAVETQAIISVTAPGGQAAVAGVSQSVTLGSFAQVGATAPFTIDVNWGDGSADTIFTAGAAGTIPAKPHAFAAAGSDTVTVTVTDNSGTVTGSATFNVAVAAGVLTVTAPANQVGFVGVAKTFTLGSFTQTGATAPFNVDVNWGDGTTDTTFSLNAAGTITAQSHTFGAVATNTVTVTVTDASGTVTGSATFTVGVTLGTIVVTPPADQVGLINTSHTYALGSFSATNVSGPFTVDVNWGDGTADTTFTANSAGTIAAQAHTYTTIGTVPATVTVTDATGLVSNFASFNVSTNGPLVVVTAPAAQTAFVSTSKSFLLGSFVQSNSTAPFTVLVNWGDGTVPTTFTTNTAGTIASKPHTYAGVGIDTVTVTVTDATGLVTSNASFSVTVTTGTTPSSTTLAASASSILSSQSIMLTATVSPSNATGTVTFLQNGFTVGTATVGAGGIATLTTTTLASGTDALTAIYSGDATFASSTSLVATVIVAPAPNTTTLTLQSSATIIATNESITLTATVAPASNGSLVATGTVTFYQGSTVLGTASVQAGGAATFSTTSGLPIGTDAVTATYAGDVNFSTSTSPAVNITVAVATSATTLTSTNHSKTVAQVVTFTATVGPASVSPSTLGSIIPVGSVTFIEDGRVLGTVPVDGDGDATFTANTPLPTGVDLITATFSGSNLFATSISTTLDLSVTQHALVPVVTKTSLPTIPVVGGTPVRASINTSLTNRLTDIETGTEKGVFGVRIFASSDITLDTTVDPIVAVVQKNAKIREGKSINVKVPITSLPASLATGTYHLLLETTDAAGNTEIIDTGSSVSVIAPVITLSGSFVSVPSNVVKKGATLSISTAGNTNDLSVFTAVVGFSTDSAGHNIVASGAGTVKPVKALIRLGKASKLRVTGWQPLFAGLPGGSYYLTVTLTDATGHSVTIVSPTAV